jgi:hypothetical protein
VASELARSIVRGAARHRAARDRRAAFRVRRARARSLDARADRAYRHLMPLSIEKILSNAPQTKKDGNAYVVAEEADAIAYLALGQEVLQIARVARIELSSEIVLHTYKGERFYFAPEQVVGFRFGGPESKHRAGGAGFTK